MILQHNDYSSAIAIYIHWPFCESKCPYCDFNSYVTENIQHEIWKEAYLKQIEYLSPSLFNKKVTSIFFGGGTPSLMNPSIVAAIINKIASIAIIDSSTEITLEANPSSVELAKFADFHHAGINRVSVGIQALNAKDLLFLGRKHSLTEAMDAIKNIGQIFNNWSFDLIYARPKQSWQDWQEELNRALEAAEGQNTHISCYQLTIEQGTKFFNMYQNNDFSLPLQDDAAKMYHVTADVLENNGYELYEISNYAKIGSQSRHNLCYWQYDDYIGIGPGAHSRLSFKDEDDVIKMQAAFMEYKPENWLNASDLSFKKIDILSINDIATEIMMMGLRLKNGITDKRLRELTGKSFIDILDHEKLGSFATNGFINYNGINLKINQSSLILHNYIVSRLLK